MVLFLRLDLSSTLERSFSKTLFKADKFLKRLLCVLEWTQNSLKAECFENYGITDGPEALETRMVTLILTISLPEFPQPQIQRWPPSVPEVLGSIPVRDSDFFFVRRSCHVDQFTFHDRLLLPFQIPPAHCPV